MADWDESVFLPAFVAAGMTKRATVSPGGGSEVVVDVLYSKPDARLAGGAVQSTQHTIEFESESLPDLREADPVAIDGEGTFRVREVPYIDGLEPTGFFVKALLTKLT